MDGNGKNGESETELLRMLLDAVHTLTGEVVKTNVKLDQTREELSGRIDQTNARLDQTNARLDQTNAKIDQTREELSGEIQALRTATSEGFALLARADSRRDAGVDELRVRVDRIEDHLGLSAER